MSRIYVASSWRNEIQPRVVSALREAGHEVYDFKNPCGGDHGFHWSEVGMASYDRGTNSDVPVEEYLAGIEHPIAVAGFQSDFDAMRWADTCVLVLPCGRSAHLELGWFVGQRKATAVLLNGPLVMPELMYRMCDAIVPNLRSLLSWVRLAWDDVRPYPVRSSVTDQPCLLRVAEKYHEPETTTCWDIDCQNPHHYVPSGRDVAFDMEDE